METFLAGWRGDVPAGWQDVLIDDSPAFACIRGDLTMDPNDRIYPGRRDSAHQDAPPGSHIFRALDDLPPEQVCAVVIGKDPYTCVSQATGRAFEQGDLQSWTASSPAPTPAPSLRRIAQQVAAFRFGCRSYGERRGGWNRLRDHLEDGTRNLESPSELFGRWRRKGVLLLNAALTSTRSGCDPHQKHDHIPLWRPIMHRICEHLALKCDIPVVFLAWGCDAQNLLIDAHIDDNSDLRTAVVKRFHPRDPRFLDGQNTFEEANERLFQMAAQRICW